MSASAQRIVWILIVAAIVYLAGNARMGLLDRDEPRYAQCSRQMLQSGDWVVPRLYDKWRTQKPPFIYWCQATSMKLFGSEGDAGAFSARLPSALAMLAALAVLAVVISRKVGTEWAMWTVFVLGTSVLPIFAAKICLTDSVLFLFVMGAQLCLYAIWRGSRSWLVVGTLAITLGLGGLTKGPFIIGIVACTSIALFVLRRLDLRLDRRAEQRRLASGFPVAGFETDGIPTAALHDRHVTPFDTNRDSQPRRAENVAAAKSCSLSPVLGGEGWGEGSGVKGRNLKNGPSSQPSPPSTGEKEPEFPGRRGLVVVAAKILVALLIVAAIVGPWMFILQHRAPGFLKMILGEAKGHAMEGKEGHWLPPGYHLLVVWGAFMPWSLLLPMAIVAGFKHRKVPEVRFALAAILGPWVMVECIGTKLPHYFLPAYPAMAFLVGFVILRALRGELTETLAKPFMIGVRFWVAAVVIVGTVPWVAMIWFKNLPWVAMVAITLFAITYAGMVYTAFRDRRLAAAFWTMGLGMWVAFVLIYVAYGPNAPFIRISNHVAEVLRREGATHPGDVRMADYKEPSLGFYQGGTIREEQYQQAFVRKPLAEWPKWMVMTRQVYETIPPETKKRLRVVDRYFGWAYADKGRREEVMVLANDRPN